ncbi:DUF4944 domain-containing protein [Bacillus swezeyi]|uniref:DUF4944 domain-containing protein n=1 Tax=Bacillus swezeyi TaxID=1925020 RepID=UPI0027DC8810|nr:DUF4944 domain-containing protein [Bacillus swezeyi]MED1738391.1 DUF4944 domain-containing protein [Bacillus swezeyi]
MGGRHEKSGDAPGFSGDFYWTGRSQPDDTYSETLVVTFDDQIALSSSAKRQ